jgi:hypothetical protein
LSPHAFAASLTKIRFGESSEGTRIVFELDETPKYEAAISPRGGLLRVTFADVSGPTASVGSYAGLIASTEREAADGVMEYSFVLAQPAAIRDAFALPPANGIAAYRLVIDLAPAPVVSSAFTAPHEDYESGFDRNADAVPAAPLFEQFERPEPPSVAWKNPNLVEVAYDSLRLSVTQSQRLGADVVAAQKYLQTSGLDASKSWRSEIDAAYALLDDGGASANLNFGLFNTYRPLALTRGGFATDSLDRWRGNAVADAAFSMSAFDGRLNLASGVALSETTLRHRLEDEPWLWIYEDGAERSDRDTASFQKLEATLFNSTRFKATLNLLYVDTGENFRSFQSNSIADIIYEGETLTLSGKIVAGSSKIEYDKESHADPVYAFDRNIVRLSRGAVSLRANIATERAASDGVVFLNDEIVSSEISLDLNKIFGRVEWLPDDIRVGYSERSALEASLFSSENAVRQSIGFGIGKGGEHFSTDLYVFWNARNDFRDAGDFAASSEFGVDVTQSFSGDNWDLSLYAGMSDMSQRRAAIAYGSQRQFTGGMTFSKQFETLPDISISFDAFDFAAEYIANDDFLRSHDLSLRAEMDVSEMLFTGERRPIERGRPLSILLGAYQGWTVSEDAFTGAQRDPETRVLLLLRRSR